MLKHPPDDSYHMFTVFFCCVIIDSDFFLFGVLSADYADMNRGQLLAKIRELEEVSIKLKNSGRVS